MPTDSVPFRRFSPNFSGGNFYVPDQGPSRGEYSRSHRGYHGAVQGGTTHTSYGISHGGMYSQAPQSSSLQPGTPGGYDTAPHASGFGSAGAWNLWAGSYSHPPTSESHSPYNPGGFRVEFQQKSRPIAAHAAAAPPSQGPAGVQNALVPISQGYLNFTLTEDNWTTMAPKKRKALVIGINYSQHPGRDFELRYCTGDAYEMADFLRTNLGFATHDIRVMTDEMENPWDIPTKENILRAMQELVSDPQPGDSFLCTIKDTDGDEDDGLDECICAMDYFGDDPNPTENTPGLIVDDVIHDILVRPLPQGCRLAALFDSCHSGTALDLPYVYDSNGVVKPFSHPEILMVLREKASNADVVSLSASRDDQSAQETHRGGALRCNLDIDISEYMEKYRIPQRPQLSTSHEIDTDLPFIV
ncbi:caspase domain-containing protein [Russula aff. rugulosa BPL654]|nr:caspase domain-containing protein [Russula aff. rugulosa BPL654]